MRQAPIAPPTAEKLAQLHALLVETRRNVETNNATVTSFLYSGIFILIRKIVPEQEDILNAMHIFLSSLGYTPDDTRNYSGIYFVLLALLAMLFYAHNRAFHGLNRLVSYFLPSGMSFDVRRPQAFMIDQQLTDTETVDTMMAELTQLNSRLKQRNGWMLFYAFSYSLILPLTTKVSYDIHSGVLSLSPGHIGAKVHFPGIAWEWDTPPNPNPMVQIVRHGLKTQQAIAINRWFYQLWCNWNMPKQFKVFLTQLTSLSHCSLWKYNPDNLTHHRTLFEFTHHDRFVSIDYQDGVLKINTINYLAELYRTCIDFGLTVYASIEAKVFTLPKQALTTRSENNFKKKLLARLLAVHENETHISHNLKQLETLPGKNDIWDYFTTVDTKGNYTIIYFAERSMLKAADDLASMMCQVNLGLIELDQDYLRINNADITAEKIQRIREQYTRVINELAASIEVFYDSRFQPVSRGSTKRIKPLKESAAPIPASTQTLAKFFFTHLRPHYFDPELLEIHTAGHFPNHFAFPLSVAWLKSETAFAAVDPRIFTALNQFCTRADIESKLFRGTVVGARKTHQTKAGGTGIIYCTDPYQNVEAINITAASFKIKFTNNIRIYGRKFNETNVSGQKRILYLFDGYGLGH